MLQWYNQLLHRLKCKNKNTVHCQRFLISWHRTWILGRINQQCYSKLIQCIRWDLECYLEAWLQQDCWELWMNFCCHPQTEVFVWIETLDDLQYVNTSLSLLLATESWGCDTSNMMWTRTSFDA